MKRALPLLILLACHSPEPERKPLGMGVGPDPQGPGVLWGSSGATQLSNFTCLDAQAPVLGFDGGLPACFPQAIPTDAGYPLPLGDIVDGGQGIVVGGGLSGTAGNATLNLADAAALNGSLGCANMTPLGGALDAGCSYAAVLLVNGVPSPAGASVTTSRVDLLGDEIRVGSNIPSFGVDGLINTITVNGYDGGVATAIVSWSATDAGAGNRGWDFVCEGEYLNNGDWGKCGISFGTLTPPDGGPTTLTPASPTCSLIPTPSGVGGSYQFLPVTSSGGSVVSIGFVGFADAGSYPVTVKCHGAIQ